MQKYFIKKYGATSTHELWTNKRFWFWRSAQFPVKFFGYKINAFPSGIILPILIAIFSTGQILFVASLSCITKIVPAYRIGKKYTQLTEYELSKVALSGPLANILFAIILSLISKDIFHSLILVNSFIAISYMVPLPGLAGSDIFFGSKNLYIFGLAFILISAILLNYINAFSALIIAIIFAIVALAVFFYYREIK